MPTKTNKNFLALDVGSKRIGLALASDQARIPNPLTTIENTSDCIDQITKIVEQEEVGTLVIGLPRGLSGQETEQTKLVRQFGTKVKAATKLPVFWQDEAVTSRQAENELRNRGLGYNKGHVDALAATYILEDFLQERHEDGEG